MQLSRVEVLARISGFLPGFVMAASNEIPKNPQKSAAFFPALNCAQTFKKSLPETHGTSPEWYLTQDFPHFLDDGGKIPAIFQARASAALLWRSSETCESTENTARTHGCESSVQ